jgi:hypothetical protein
MRPIVGTWGRCGVGAVLAMLLFGCGDSNVEKIDRTKTASGTVSAAAEAAGIGWTVPSAWVTAGPRPMRVATYQIGEGAATAECAVVYFGLGQGGEIQANINRWIGQFAQPDGSDSKSKARIDNVSVAGLKMTTIDLAGTYVGGMGGSMPGQAVQHAGWRLLGAIIEAPQGPVFFKLTGPDASVDAARADFDRLIASVKKR